MSEEKAYISFKQAKKYLPKGKEIHTIRSAGIATIGCSWDRKTLLKAMKHHPIEITGENAQAMHHGLAIYDEEGPLFIETTRRTDNKEVKE